VIAGGPAKWGLVAGSCYEGLRNLGDASPAAERPQMQVDRGGSGMPEQDVTYDW